jgi:hypothetical protein
MKRLDRLGRIVLMVQALLLSGLGVAGLLAAAGSLSGVGHVAGFSLSTSHCVLLLVTAGVSGLMASRRQAGRIWAMAQAILFTLAFVIGVASSAGRPQDARLALNTPDYALHLGLALVGGVLSTALFWPKTSDDHELLRILPGDPPPPGQRTPQTREEESQETRDMIAAEVAVTEGQATPEQVRRVEEDAQHRADTERHRAWHQSDGFSSGR